MSTVAELTGDKEFYAGTMVPAYIVADPTITMGQPSWKGPELNRHRRG